MRRAEAAAALRVFLLACREMTGWHGHMKLRPVSASQTSFILEMVIEF